MNSVAVEKLTCLPECYRCGCKPCECSNGFCEADLQCALYVARRKRGGRMLLHNANICKWQQDFIEITRAGYLFEFEIKLSLADYHADMRKMIDLFLPRRRVAKHDLLSGKASIPELLLPRRFWYVLPTALAVRIDPPEYAGLLAATPGKFDWLKCVLTTLKRAPPLRTRRLQTRDYQLVVAAQTRKMQGLRIQGKLFA